MHTYGEFHVVWSNVTLKMYDSMEIFFYGVPWMENPFNFLCFCLDTSKMTIYSKQKKDFSCSGNVETPIPGEMIEKSTKIWVHRFFFLTKVQKWN